MARCFCPWGIVRIILCQIIGQAVPLTSHKIRSQCKSRALFGITIWVGLTAIALGASAFSGISLPKHHVDAQSRRTWLCILFFFRFRLSLFFQNPENSVEFPDSGGTHVGIKSFSGKINLFWNLPESGIRPEFRRKGPMNMVFCATWNKHSPWKHEKNRCQ